MATFTLTINTTQNHACIVIGNKGHYLQKLNKKYNVLIEIHNKDMFKNRHHPFFTVTGEKSNIQNAAIHIYSILHKSMFETEANLRQKIFEKNEKHSVNKLLIVELQEKIDILNEEIATLKKKLNM